MTIIGAMILVVTTRQLWCSEQNLVLYKTTLRSMGPITKSIRGILQNKGHPTPQPSDPPKLFLGEGCYFGAPHIPILEPPPLPELL